MVEAARLLALDVSRQTTAVRICVAQLGEHRLRVARDQLVQHGPLGSAALVAAKRLSGDPGLSVRRDHRQARRGMRFRAGSSRPHVARLQYALSECRTSSNARRHHHPVADTADRHGRGVSYSICVISEKLSSSILLASSCASPRASASSSVS